MLEWIQLMFRIYIIYKMVIIKNCFHGDYFKSYLPTKPGISPYKHFTIWRMTQNMFKNIIGNVASSYQVNLAIEIPNITENYINSNVFSLVGIGYLQCLFEYTSRCWEVFLIGHIFF